MPFLQTRNCNLYFEDIGRGAPVLLLHAFPLSSASFHSQIQQLAQTYRFILPDLRGFGQSRTTENTWNINTLAEDVLALLDHLQLDSVVLGGVSMGGYVSMELLRLDASRIRGLILIDTQATADDEESILRRESTALAIETQGVSAIEETLLPRLLGPHAAPELKHTIQQCMRTTSAHSLARAQRAMALRQDSRDILSRFGGAAMVVVGEQDVLTPPAKARHMSNLISTSTLVEIAEAGHLSNMEQPAVFARHLEAFLASVYG